MTVRIFFNFRNYEKKLYFSETVKTRIFKARDYKGKEAGNSSLILQKNRDANKC